MAKKKKSARSAKPAAKRASAKKGGAKASAKRASTKRGAKKPAAKRSSAKKGSAKPAAKRASGQKRKSSAGSRSPGSVKQTAMKVLAGAAAGAVRAIIPPLEEAAGKSAEAAGIDDEHTTKPEDDEQ